MKTAAEINTALGHCCCSDAYYKNAMLGKLVYTSGVKTMHEMCDAYWLLTTIASHQPEAMRDESLQYMQFWTLTVKDGDAVLICERDEGDVVITQDIGPSDFPLPEMKIWIELGSLDGLKPAWIMMLPTER